MQYETFFVPLRGGESEKDALNAFLRSHRILKAEHQLVEGGWAFCVEWLFVSGAEGVAGLSGGGAWNRPPKVDYREKLAPEQFAIFSKLRDARRKLAEAEGVQVYTVMTNEQLAEMVTREVKSLAEVGKIEGVGEARLRKYGAALLDAMSRAKTEGGDAKNETSANSPSNFEAAPPEEEKPF